jgi:hypothetical protein
MSAVFAAILFCDGAAALAGPVPEEAIQQQHKSCVEACIKRAPADRCNAGCSCADGEVRKNFTLEEYTRLGQVVSPNPKASDFPPDLVAKIQGIDQVCFQR